MKLKFPLLWRAKLRVMIAGGYSLFWCAPGFTQDIAQTYASELPIPMWALGAFAALIVLVSAYAVDYIRNLKIRLFDIESDLARSAAEWSYAMDFLEDPMYLVDLDDRLIRANRAFFNQIGKNLY